MGRKVAVVGAGMTTFVRRALETGKELAWEAARLALESAELTLADIDAVCIGSAPDAFDALTERPLGPNLLWIFALEMHRYMHAYGLDKADIARVAVKNKRNAAGH